MTLSPRSTLAVYVDALWFPICVAGAIVPRALNATAVAGIMLVGLTLLAYEKDRRYPRLSWRNSLRTFSETHEWSALFVWITLSVAFVGLSSVRDRDPRGLCIIAATVYVLFRLGAVRRAPQCAPVDAQEPGLHTGA